MKRTLIVGVALALAPIFALAADDTKKSAGSSTSSMSSQNGSFTALDKNSDGSLSQDELKGQTGLNFTTLDKDRDGKVSAQEWADHQKGAAGPTGPTGAAGAAGSTSGSSTSPSSTSPSSSTPSSTTPSSSSTTGSGSTTGSSSGSTK